MGWTDMSCKTFCMALFAGLVAHSGYLGGVEAQPNHLDQMLRLVGWLEDARISLVLGDVVGKLLRPRLVGRLEAARVSLVLGGVDGKRQQHSIMWQSLPSTWLPFLGLTARVKHVLDATGLLSGPA